MRYDLRVLRALFRMSKASSRLTAEGLLHLAGGTPGALAEALVTLEAEGFVQRGARAVRLTFAGLALAAALGPAITTASGASTGAATRDLKAGAPRPRAKKLPRRGVPAVERAA
jgi:DNA-binding IclR family transcriptional regulator